MTANPCCSQFKVDLDQYEVGENEGCKLGDMDDDGSLVVEASTSVINVSSMALLPFVPRRRQLSQLELVTHIPPREDISDYVSTKIWKGMQDY